jgi:hypothetical protein
MRAVTFQFPRQICDGNVTSPEELFNLRSSLLAVGEHGFAIPFPSRCASGFGKSGRLQRGSDVFE